MTNDQTRIKPPADARPEDKTEKQIDQAIADSFPASDPPSTTPLAGVGDAPEGASDPTRRGSASGPSCIIAYIGEEMDKYAPVINTALETASTHGARLIFYDAEAGGRFGSPTPTFWSGDRDKELPSQLEPANLEAAGRGVVARLVADAQAAGVNAFGWLPDSRKAEDLKDYAEYHSADLIIVPSDIEDVSFLERLAKGTDDVDKIVEKVHIPVMTVDIDSDRTDVPREEVRLA